MGGRRKSDDDVPRSSSSSGGSGGGGGGGGSSSGGGGGGRRRRRRGGGGGRGGGSGTVFRPAPARGLWGVSLARLARLESHCSVAFLSPAAAMPDAIGAMVDALDESILTPGLFRRPVSGAALEAVRSYFDANPRVRAWVSCFFLLLLLLLLLRLLFLLRRPIAAVR